MLTTVKVCACYEVKILKKQTPMKFSQRESGEGGGGPGSAFACFIDGLMSSVINSNL